MAANSRPRSRSTREVSPPRRRIQFAHRRRIVLQHDLGSLRYGHGAAVVVPIPGAMKSQHCPAGDADAAARQRAQDERASRKARAVDDHPLSRCAHGFEQRDEGADLAAGAGQDTHLRVGRRSGGRAEQCRQYNASKKDFRSPTSLQGFPLERSTDLRNALPTSLAVSRRQEHPSPAAPSICAGAFDLSALHKTQSSPAH